MAWKIIATSDERSYSITFDPFVTKENACRFVDIVDELSDKSDNVDEKFSYEVIEEKTKVYLITSGEYSDYSVDHVFSTEEKAQAFLDKHNKFRHIYGAEYNDIEEYEVDEIDDVPENGYPYGKIVMDRDGIIIKQEFYRIRTEAKKDIYFQALLNRWSRNCSGVLTYCGPFTESDLERMIKAANERRGELIANNHWKIVAPLAEF